MRVYCDYDGRPAIFDAPGISWVWSAAEKKWIHDASLDVGMNAAVVSHSRFVEMFGDLPDPPTEPPSGPGTVA